MRIVNVPMGRREEFLGLIDSSPKSDMSHFGTINNDKLSCPLGLA
jgi:hypothetical protein